MFQSDPILQRFRAAIDHSYGDRVERVVLFGSRARGDARPDSDYDIAVFLRDLSDRWKEADKIAELATDVMEETGTFIHAMPYPAGFYAERTPLMPRGPRPVTPEFRRILTQTYNLKAVADYETGPGSVIPLERARAAVESANRFIECIANVLLRGPSGKSA